MHDYQFSCLPSYQVGMIPFNRSGMALPLFRRCRFQVASSDGGSLRRGAKSAGCNDASQY
jgi:hypothetical protein